MTRSFYSHHVLKDTVWISVNLDKELVGVFVYLPPTTIGINYFLDLFA